MKAKKIPAPQRAGTANDDRATREAALVEDLEIMRVRDPDGFAEMMQLLARLVVSVRDQKK